MNLIKYTFLITSFLLFLIKNSFGCEIKARVSVVGNEFPAIQTVGAGAKKCKGAEVKTNLTADHQKINVAGMSSEPAEYTSAIVANTSIVALLNNDLIRPLDDLVKKHGSKLKKNQLITNTVYFIKFIFYSDLFTNEFQFLYQKNDINHLVFLLIQFHQFLRKSY